MAQGENNRKPTERQQRYLRQLAIERGESFTPPRTMAEASAEIRRLKSRRPSSRVETRIDRKAVSEAFASAGGAARVTDDEVTGYGGSATWRKRG
jgi:hypothetical protein